MCTANVHVPHLSGTWWGFLCLFLSWGCQFHPHDYSLGSFVEVLFSPHMKLEPCFSATHFSNEKESHNLYREGMSAQAFAQ